MRMRLIAVFVAALTLLTGNVADAAARRRSASKKTSVTKTSPAKKSAAKRRGRRPVARGPMAPSEERIREIQGALTRAGYYRQQPTGRVDAATQAAISSFQQANGLERTGTIGPLTLKKLEQHGLAPNSSYTAAEQGKSLND